MKISTRDETRHETVKGSDTWKASADSRHLERKPPRILLLSSIASFSVIERETDTRPTAVAGNQPSSWQLHPDEYRSRDKKAGAAGTKVKII